MRLGEAVTGALAGDEECWPVTLPLFLCLHHDLVVSELPWGWFQSAAAFKLRWKQFHA